MKSIENPGVENLLTVIHHSDGFYHSWHEAWPGAGDELPEYVLDRTKGKNDVVQVLTDNQAAVVRDDGEFTARWRIVVNQEGQALEKRYSKRTIRKLGKQGIMFVPQAF